ncbi:MAG TPA: GNAT family N-acetyltransferase, partial [Chloroflexia bacterium]|nr:GNAT family N-acetyltransferase [Chloroflexia bacterium]
ALKGVRGRKPVDLEAVEHLLVRFSQLVVEQRWIKEIDINPLLASPERLVALDARVVLHEPGVSEDELPRPAIRPYPLQYVREWTTKDGVPLLIRPIRPEDEPLVAEFHKRLSTESVYMRYFQHVQLGDRVAHERLVRICFNDFDREAALVAEHLDPQTGQRAIVGVGRLSRSHVANEASFAITINDAWQGRGLGQELLRRLVQIGRDEKLDRITAEILPENRGMIRVSEKVGFKIVNDHKGDEVRAVLEL